MMTKTGMLVVTNPSRFSILLPRIQKEIKKTLYVQFYPERKLRLPGICSFPNKNIHGSMFSSTVIDFYVNSTLFGHLDIRVLLGSLKDLNLTKVNTKKPIEVVYFDYFLKAEEMVGFISNCVSNKTSNCEVISLKNDDQAEYEINPQKMDSYEMFDNVVLGGTFDRLHAGHKILLSEAILRCRKKITVGVTDTEMLKSKKLWELIEPCQMRISKVQEFLEDVGPSLEFEVVPINDIYGPTKDDPSLEMLVVSSETIGGGSKVNELRLKNNLKPLAVHSVGLLNDVKLDEEEEDKVSSSNGRLRLLGTRIRLPSPKPWLPIRPYIIGLTGGIASGKSSISDRLRSLGAGVINCDQIAHDLYQKGNPGYKLIVEQFGDSIIDSNGEINRGALGDVVFNNKDKLNKLNNVLWPRILERTKERCVDLYKKGHEVVVVEAAVLIEAGWEKECHEIWACIISPEEAIKRIEHRNKMSATDAKTRISMQPSNLEYVANSQIVFCTSWRLEYTNKQVDKAWFHLINTLDSTTHHP